MADLLLTEYWEKVVSDPSAKPWPTRVVKGEYDVKSRCVCTLTALAGVPGVRSCATGRGAVIRLTRRKKPPLSTGAFILEYIHTRF